MKDTNKLEVTISNRTVLRVIGLILVITFAISFMKSVSYILQLVLIGFFLALALNPAVSWIARNLGLKSRATATGFAYLAVVLILGTFLASVVPPLVKQTGDFVREVPSMVSEIKAGDSAVSRFIRNNNLDEQIDGLSDNLRKRTANMQPVITTAGKLGSALISIITVLVLTFMMLVEGPAWLKRYIDLQPEDRRKRHQKLARDMYGMVTGYVNGQLLLAVIGASFAFIVLLISSTLLNVSVNAVALAGILAVTGLIPMIGNTIGGIIVVLASLFVSLPLAVIMAIFFVIYQQIENITLQPYIQAKYNELTPLLVFIAALLGIGYAGLLGALIAIPAAGCAKILLQDYLSRRKTT